MTWQRREIRGVVVCGICICDPAMHRTDAGFDQIEFALGSSEIVCVGCLAASRFDASFDAADPVSKIQVAMIGKQRVDESTKRA